MALVFHWSGTIEVVRDKLKRCAMGVYFNQCLLIIVYRVHARVC